LEWNGAAAGWVGVVGTPHSVTTAHLVDEDGHPTLTARDEIIAFLTARLHSQES